MITNTILPYCYDIAHVLSLPPNFSHRFRYHSKWIHPDCDINGLKGKETLLILRNRGTGELIPIRYAEVEDILTVGAIHYIEFRVSHYVSTADSVTVSQKVNQEFLNAGFHNKAGEDLNCLVLELDHKPLMNERGLSPETSRQAWGELLRQIGKLQCYKDYGFLKIIHVRNSKGSEAVARPDETGKYSYCLMPATLYYIDLIQQIPWELEQKESIEAPYDVELNAETDEIIVLRKLQRVVGKYDLLRFIFKTPSGHTRKHTFIEVQNKQGGEAAKYGLPALFLPIRVEPTTLTKFVLIGRLVIAGLAVAVLFGSESVATIFHIGPDWIRALALLTLVLATNKWDDFVGAFLDEAKEIKLKTNLLTKWGQ